MANRTNKPAPAKQTENGPVAAKGAEAADNATLQEMLAAAKAAQAPAAAAAPAKATRTPTGQGRVAKATGTAGIPTTAVTAMAPLQVAAYVAYLQGVANPNARQVRHLARALAHLPARGLQAPTPAQAAALRKVVAQPGGWATLATGTAYPA